MAEDKRKLQAAVREREILQASLEQDKSGGIHQELPFLDYYRLYVEKHKTKHSEFSLRNFEKFSIEMGIDSIQIGQLKTKHIELYISFLQEKGLEASTIRTYLIPISAALTNLVKQGVIQMNPANNAKRPKVSRKPIRYLTVEHIQALLATPLPVKTDRDIVEAFEFSLNCGLRFSDLKALKFSDIQNGSITILQEKTKDQVVIPLNRRAAEIVAYQRAKYKSGLVFNLPALANYNYSLGLWGGAAGLPFRLSSHYARHSAAISILSAGGSIYQASQILGHKSVATTEASYAAIADKAKQAAVDSIQY
jgi:integrase